MAKYERSFPGSISSFLPYFHDNIMGSISATAEDGTDLTLGEVRTAFRVYERYSMFGGNRVSMALSLAEHRGTLHASVITSGGTEASFFKVLPIGEMTWLDKAAQVIDAYAEGS
ncbi:hypothetical protein J4N02_01925 [Propioniciclava sp. MC1595]|uniref:DUF6054 family protein n=1 Tax=unclassified Propioniciclava TaxID=2642922 RepID=UPI00160397D3|nr:MULTISPECIES: DUF6054 family protein [unclassified Propioniciclava]MBB1496131.1 hypothetical protein [Propioniciclava sp. MC1595]MBB1502802.1 hypothetical protein [Propioniciclava sp. MC1683]QTE26411.1 hypothetical protein J4N02_01925 [Propioniciclava sp. MC1595]